jgi:hypothetical protein
MIMSGLAPEPVWTVLGKVKNLLPLPEIEHRTVKPVEESLYRLSCPDYFGAPRETKLSDKAMWKTSEWK